jgi:hypothetical protein
MAKTNTAVWAQTPKTATAIATAAIGAITTDAPTGTVMLLTAGAEGAIVTRLTAMPRATVTDSSLCLFLSKDAGVTQRLIDSELLGAQTVNATSAINEKRFGNITEAEPLRLEAGDRLYVGSQVALASGIVFKAEYTDF